MGDFILAHIVTNKTKRYFVANLVGILKLYLNGSKFAAHLPLELFHFTSNKIIALWYVLLMIHSIQFDIKNYDMCN